VVVNCNTDNVLSVCEGDDIVNALKHFWDTESIGVVDDSQSQTEGGSFLERLQFNNGCYEVHLPWRDYGLEVPDHFALCLNRLRLLHVRLLKSPDLLKKYHTIIQEQLKNGIVEMVSEDPQDANTPVHYLPHHGVLRHECLLNTCR